MASNGEWTRGMLVERQAMLASQSGLPAYHPQEALAVPLSRWENGAVSLEMETKKLRLKKFMRINEECKMVEGNKLFEPLDELRIDVADWLNS
jgi:hypothetical protein